jgi:protein-disulfide isomerase
MSFTNRVKGVLDLLSIFVTIAAAGMLIWTLSTRGRVEARPQPIEEVKGLAIQARQLTNVSGSGRLAIVEFSDYQCPYCRRHATETFPILKRTLVESGTVRYVVMHNPLQDTHALAFGAGEAAECAARQGRFWEMHERLFSHANALAVTDLVQHAQALALDGRQFERCLLQHEAQEKVRADAELGRKLGVTGTPAFFLGTVRSDGGVDLRTRIRGAVAEEVFKEQIAKLADSTRHVSE